MDLVERHHELAVLRDAVAGVCRGQGAGVALVRDAGTGKSVLLDAVIGQVAGLRMLRGSCDPLRTPRPLGPFRDIGVQVGFAQLLAGEDVPLARVCEPRLRVQLRRDGACIVPARARAATRANPGGLTNRQVDVARLVARGLTNAEIAERLYVSPKAADHHVSAVLAKLGLSSRRAVVRADELGLG